MDKFESQIPHIQQFESFSHTLSRNEISRLDKDSKERNVSKSNQDLSHEIEENVLISPLIDKALDIHSYREAIKSKNKIKFEQKRIITYFVTAITSPTIEAVNNVHHSKQSIPPLEKTKLLELFFNYLSLDPPVSTSVFWKYIKRDVYIDRNIYRNKKIGGYKGLSGVQFRNPNNPSDFEHIISKLSKIELNLSHPKESLVELLREMNDSNALKKDIYKRKKRSACEANLDMDLKMYIENQKLDTNNDLQYDLEDNISSQQLNNNNNNSTNNVFLDIPNMLNIFQYLNSPTILEVLKLLNDPNVLLALQKLKSMGQGYNQSNTTQK